MSKNKAVDSFQLYDLRIEVEGTRIMCGAKAGDSFILQGEMLFLPPGQGISIYSLCQSVFFFSSSDVNGESVDSRHTTVITSQAAGERPE